MQLLHVGVLRDADVYTENTEGTTPVFRRRSCCPYYRVPGGGTCRDCPLDPDLRTRHRRR